MTEKSLQAFGEKMDYLISSDRTNEYWYKRPKNLCNAIYKNFCQYVNSSIRKKVF